ncbi:hypothetical protein [Frankia sp. AgB32]|uniref:hypothetical protein n=1 Tax=Frankia sp. AgB32 TaxID=631119 RepID=UPI00200F7F98|nr:hypothetical protein [Frankia sp. AgB32]MCK9896157.1 hypothetical protein [Frankia sp. AgB32]
MHRVQEQAEVRAAHVAHRGERAGEIAGRQRRRELHRRLQPPRRGQLGEQRELVEAADDIGIHAHDVDPGDAELGHRVQIGGAVADVAARMDQAAAS